MRKYKLLKKKGEGTFSEVLAAQNIKTGQLCAIKCMKQTFNTIEQVNNLREIQALRRLSPHPNIVKLHEVLYDKPTGRLALVFELMSFNLYELIRGRRRYLDGGLVKIYAWQLLRGLSHMHSRGIFHRDIKPENVLVDETYDVYTGLKVADFGSCRSMYSKQPYTEYISTRWYRAPECLLTDGYYGAEMDVWGAACVLFEISALFPLFPGTDERDQIRRIHAVVGTPNQTLLNRFKAHGNSHIDFSFPPERGTGIASLAPHIDAQLIDLLTKMLAYDPTQRWTADQALQHAYFNDLRSVPIPAELQFPDNSGSHGSGHQSGSGSSGNRGEGGSGIGASSGGSSSHAPIITENTDDTATDSTDAHGSSGAAGGSSSGTSSKAAGTASSSKDNESTRQSSSKRMSNVSMVSGGAGSAAGSSSLGGSASLSSTGTGAAGGGAKGMRTSAAELAAEARNLQDRSISNNSTNPNSSTTTGGSGNASTSSSKPKGHAHLQAMNSNEIIQHARSSLQGAAGGSTATGSGSGAAGGDGRSASKLGGAIGAASSTGAAATTGASGSYNAGRKPSGAPPASNLNGSTSSTSLLRTGGVGGTGASSTGAIGSGVGSGGSSVLTGSSNGASGSGTGSGSGLDSHTIVSGVGISVGKPGGGTGASSGSSSIPTQAHSRVIAPKAGDIISDARAQAHLRSDSGNTDSKFGGSDDYSSSNAGGRRGGGGAAGGGITGAPPGGRLAPVAGLSSSNTSSGVGASKPSIPTIPEVDSKRSGASGTNVLRPIERSTLAPLSSTSILTSTSTGMITAEERERQRNRLLQSLQGTSTTGTGLGAARTGSSSVSPSAAGSLTSSTGIGRKGPDDAHILAELFTLGSDSRNPGGAASGIRGTGAAASIGGSSILAADLSRRGRTGIAPIAPINGAGSGTHMASSLATGKRQTGFVGAGTAASVVDRVSGASVGGKIIPSASGLAPLRPLQR